MPRKQVAVPNTHRHIDTSYYADFQAKRLLKVTSAKYPLRAVQHCVGYMRTNKYEAMIAEVHDTTTGKVYAVVKRSVAHNQIIIVFEDKTEVEVLNG